MSGSWITQERRQAIYRRDDRRCIYCCTPEGTGLAALTLDHITPRELGGGNETANLVTACLSCNSSKQDLPLPRFLRKLEKQGQDPRMIRARIQRAKRLVLRAEEVAA